MFKPQKIKSVTLNKWENYAPHIPFGFWEFEEQADGTGNYYGLYWSFGKENLEPIICWFEHEQSCINISHKNLKEFLLEFNQSEEEHELVDFSFAFKRMKLKAQKGEFEFAISQLNKYLSYVPEHSEAWEILSDVYLRIGNKVESDNCALKSILSNWSFGLPRQKSIQLFKKIDRNGILSNDPLVKRLDEILLTFEYNKTEISYNTLKEAYLEYFDNENYIESLILEHNYALMMYFETQAFQDKHNFKVEKWRIEYEQKCKKYLNRYFV